VNWKLDACTHIGMETIPWLGWSMNVSRVFFVFPAGILKWQGGENIGYS
jgi:hypothetical protein